MQRSIGRESRIRQERRINSLTRRNNGLRENLSFPSQSIVQGEIRRYLPPILCEQSVVFVLDVRCAWLRHSRQTGRYAVLQVKKQWSTNTASGRARLIERSGLRYPSCKREVWSKAFADAGPESIRGRRR